MSTVDRDVFVLLMAATRVEKWAHVILLSLGASMLVTVVLWMRNLFGFAVVLAWGVALITLARRGMANARRFLLSLLAVQVALNSVYDIRVLFLIDPLPDVGRAVFQLRSECLVQRQEEHSIPIDEPYLFQIEGDSMCRRFGP